jgi:hypothetical protein
MSKSRKRDGPARGGHRDTSLFVADAVIAVPTRQPRSVKLVQLRAWPVRKLAGERRSHGCQEGTRRHKLKVGGSRTRHTLGPSPYGQILRLSCLYPVSTGKYCGYPAFTQSPRANTAAILRLPSLYGQILRLSCVYPVSTGKYCGYPAFTQSLRANTAAILRLPSLYWQILRLSCLYPVSTG